jgi:hypothetical protein
MLLLHATKNEEADELTHKQTDRQADKKAGQS